MLTRTQILQRLQTLIDTLHEQVEDEMRDSPLDADLPFYEAICYTFEDRLKLEWPYTDDGTLIPSLEDDAANLPRSLMALIEAEQEPNYEQVAATFLSDFCLPAIHIGNAVLGPSLGRTALRYYYCYACQDRHYEVPIPGEDVLCDFCEDIDNPAWEMTYVSAEEVAGQQTP